MARRTQLPAYGNSEKKKKCSHRKANGPPSDKETCAKCNLWSETNFEKLPDVCPVGVGVLEGSEVDVIDLVQDVS